MDAGWSSGRRRDGWKSGRVSAGWGGGGYVSTRLSKNRQQKPNIDILVIFEGFLSLSLSPPMQTHIYIKYKLLEAWTHRTDPRLSRLQLNGKEIYNNSDCSEP